MVIHERYKLGHIGLSVSIVSYIFSNIHILLCTCSQLTGVFSAFHLHQRGQQRPIYGSFAQYIQCNLIHRPEPVKKFNGGIERKELAIPKEIRKALGCGRPGRGA